MDLGLKGKVAIVAAASQGLGRAVATELAREGAEVAICSRNEKNLAAAADAMRGATGRSVFAQPVDINNASSIEKFVAAVELKFGRVDICVTNSGGPPAKTFLEITQDDWRAAVDSLLMSVVWWARAVLPRMQKQKWGRLLSITSMSVKQPVEGLLLSNTLRAGVTGLMKTLANEFGPSGITVNNIAPGYTATDRLNELVQKQARDAGVPGEKILERWSEQIPLRRVATVEEFAAVAAFLVSERASYLNGVTIPVDGGWVRGLL